MYRSTELYTFFGLLLLLTIQAVAFPMTISSVIAQNPGISITRDMQILSTNSKGFLRINGSQIDALGSREDENTQLQIETTNVRGKVGVTIKSKVGNKYVCVRTTGGLVLEADGSTLDRCAFVQDIRIGYTTFQSLYNNAWFLGFKRCGKAKRPSLTSVGQNAARFLEYYV